MAATEGRWGRAGERRREGQWRHETYGSGGVHEKQFFLENVQGKHFSIYGSLAGLEVLTPASPFVSEKKLLRGKKKDYSV